MKSETITVNRKAYHDYLIEDTLEAGLVLTGTEIKSIRLGRMNLRDSFARPEAGELWLVGAHIARYEQGGRYNHEPARPRKLLLHKDEILKLSLMVEKKGLTLVPLKVYVKRGIAKVELGVARGKRLHDKRRSIIQRETEREMERVMKARK
ncbi:SsrA-binding protein SmpB [Dehalococcoidia bacterium]|nr:SsrA-binding protein SmpB [Dehalococcoidia bacterium]MCL0069652.1 SsrA-binding protein SmpB [Dehalococcoidia bacterium]MCL0080309.1 SsrA-binding protein SmpB [Dehalococcoidia bacterium]MCL0097462.1 SsrA-binding protein SmpB [Dehalococcoidia bacterium]MCL0098825.1 SsrA-binding protein SmpB [Dehalococcoidia bacterium]